MSEQGSSEGKRKIYSVLIVISERVLGLWNAIICRQRLFSKDRGSWAEVCLEAADDELCVLLSRTTCMVSFAYSLVTTKHPLLVQCLFDYYITYI